ncbi:RecX family transcriptional regulator [Nesterenkonia sp. CF4.4]|uniref:RecX family transcriptional regulator n=1 Tax=Nesterenkonia sp. CF4.4 TaxID=3373079 RepID=UPI003EE636E4
MGDQQQKIEALRAAMTSIQERDPDAPVPDFLVVDTSVPEKPPESTSTGPAGAAGPSDPAASSAATGPEEEDPEEEDPEDEDAQGEDPEAEASDADESAPGDVGFARPVSEEFDSGPLRFSASPEARPLVDPNPAPDTVDAEMDGPGTDEAETDEAETVEAETVDLGTADQDPSKRTSSAPLEIEHDDDDVPAGAMAGVSPEEQYEKARAVVLRRLTGSPKSRHQLAVALKEKDFHPEVITRVLDRMEEVHLINDVEFAQTWVRGRHELKNLGKSALRRELREKGISEHVAADALEQISAEDESEAARELVRRKLQGKTVPTGPSPEERAERDKLTRRLVSMLARRGHSPGAAFQIVREVIEAHTDA